MKVQGYILLGKISKPYGLQGEVSLAIEPGKEDYIKKSNPLFVEIDGQRVPFFMEDLDLLSDRQAIVKLEFSDSLEQAAKLTGYLVYLEQLKTEKDPEHSDDPASFLDYLVVDSTLGELGGIMEYIPAEQNPLWVIRFRDKEILVPAIGEFIVNINHKKRVLTVDLPPGILDL